DVGVELGRIRLRALLSELYSFGHDGLHFIVDRLQFVLGRLGGGEKHLDVVDRVAGLLDLVHLFLGPVLGRVGHGVAAIAVGLHFQDVGTFAGAGARHGAGGGVTHGQDIHAVDLLAGNPEAGAALIQFGRGRRAFDARAHGVLVVLDDVDGRQLPQLRHVEALVDLPLVRGAVAEIDEADRVVAAVLAREGQPRAQRDLRADDAVTAIEAGRYVEHVHRPALALGRTADAARQLGHDFLRVHARSQHVAVVAIARDDLVVALLDALLNADGHGFLTDVQVAEAPDQAHAVELARALFKATDENHLAVETQQVFLGSLRRVRNLFARAGRVFLSGGFRHPASPGLHPCFRDSYRYRKGL